MGKIITGVLIFMIFSQASVLMYGAIPNPGYFSIANFTHVMSAPTITITSPNGGENLVGGTTHTIRWTSSQTFDSIDIEYYNGTQWTVIVYGTQDDGSYSWLVPNISTTNARLWIKGWSSSGNPTDYSDNTFTISKLSNSITITSPNGGENLVGGTIYKIQWVSSKEYDKIDIEYYNGFQWNLIVNGTQDDGSYSWQVPNISTTNASVWIKGWSSTGNNPTDYSDGTFTISKSSGSITVTSPNGGEVWRANTTENIRWTSSGNVGNVKILYSTDGGYNWITIITSTSNDGLHAWTLPSISSSNCLIKISDVSNSQISDMSNSTFSISFPESIIITSPNGGEVWIAGSTENITWLSTGNSFNVIICYSTDGGSSWNIIATSTTNDGTYAWTLPNVSSSDCLIWILDALDGIISDMSDSTFSIVPITTQPEIYLNRSRLNFGAVTSGRTTFQSFLISNSGGGTLNWVITDNVNWLNYSSDSGQNSEVINVTVNPSGLSVGTHTAIIAVSDVNASNSPQLINVTLKIYNPSKNALPFGSFATPENGITGVAGSIAVTGWVLDDIEVESVRIYREVYGTLSFIGDAVFVEGARPDVEQAYPDYPYNYRAGWGYMMLTNFLPDGQLVLKAIATDIAGRQVELGTKTITVDNAHAVKPFGAIDSPTQGGEASGTRYRNNGWALTPQPNKIPVDGSTISIFIDGYIVGKANYNLYRSDIATLFPGYANTNGSWGYLDFDTTAYNNGVHTIAWSVTDNAGNTDGIGSRYFTIQNTGGSTAHQAQSTERKAAGSRVRRSTFNADLSQLPVNYSEPIIIRKGYRQSSIPQIFYPGDNGTINTEINELERVEVQLNTGAQWSSSNQSNAHYEGYLVVDNKLRPLPIGSTLEAQKGIFCWQPGPGFLGKYRFIFIKKDRYGEERKDIKVKILPEFRLNENPPQRLEIPDKC